MTPETPLVTVSPQFRNQAIRSVLAIALFVLVYLVLLAVALSSVYLAGVGGLALFLVFPHIITIIAGLGMLAAAGLFVYFMLKFMFHRSVTDNSGDIEITRQQEPHLFAMIDEIVGRLGVKPPRKVFLGPEVNASVTYNSSFWSMFFPVRKNLRIGMGLINSLREDELRAVIAHEFGHFSQRSMAVGSYVYNVNYVIFQLVNDDEHFTTTAHNIATSSIYVYPFAMVSIYAVQATRWLLAKMYGLVNLSYMGLSREMEYHADAVAASLGGGHALASGLRRIELADACYNKAVGFTASQLAEKFRVGNIYSLQTCLLEDTARRDGLTLIDGLPEVSGEHSTRYLKSKIEAGRQWASHPEIEDRITQLGLLSDDPVIPSSIVANELLSDRVARQQQFSHQMTAVFHDIANCTNQEEDISRELLLSKEEDNLLPNVFNGYYDNHNLLTDQGPDVPLTSDNLFSDDAVEVINSLTVLQHDLQLLDAIKDKQIDLKTFDYDGKKYKRREARKLAVSLNASLIELREQVESHDREVIARAFAKARQLGSETGLQQELDRFRSCDELFDKFNEAAQSMRNASMFMQETLQVDAIKHRMILFKSCESDFREALELALKHPDFSAAANPLLLADTEKFMRKEWNYFRYDRYDDVAIGLLFANVEHLEFLLNSGYWRAKRRLMDLLAGLFEGGAEGPA
ncbi:M48 family metallopeptidase [Neolewinella persica]|uniref:M48 family metallopeptidase n=1 Tax=Neolewinella persica TaxID=70998 RepID=UPI00035E60D2|nr:M48 family metallopeptidase [Neolewinella persica]